MSLQNPTFDKYISPFKAKNYFLWQALDALARNQTDLVTNANAAQTTYSYFEYRFELPGVQTVANDVYPVWKQVKVPLDSNNNAVGSGQQILRADLNCKVASASGPYTIDVLVSKDNGVTFNSILPPTNAQKLFLPQGIQFIKYGGMYFSNNILQDGWFFRIDVLVADGTVEGVELILRGDLVL